MQEFCVAHERIERHLEDLEKCYTSYAERLASVETWLKINIISQMIGFVGVIGTILSLVHKLG